MSWIKVNLNLKWILDTFLVLIFYIVMQISTWLPLRFWHAGDGKFGDLNQVLIWSECFSSNGNLVYEVRQGDICSNYNYGSILLRILPLVNLKSENLYYYGYGFIFIFAIATGFILSRVSFKSRILVILPIIASPPFMLIMERGNLDIIMLGTLILSALAFFYGFQKSSLILVFISVLLKFYTLPIFLIYLLLSKSNAFRIQVLTSLVIAGIVVLEDLAMIKKGFPMGGETFFGMSIWPRYLAPHAPNHLLPESLNHLAGLIIFFLLAMLLLRSRMLLTLKAFDHGQIKVYKSSFGFLFIVLYVVHLTCYISGTSYDYRLIYVAFSTISLLVFYGQFKLDDLNVRVLVTLLISTLWLSFPSGGLQPLGDLSLEVLTIILGFHCWNLLRNNRSLLTK
jgi:hypothetical protein